MTTIRTINQDGERWINLRDFGRALKDPEMLEHAKHLMKVGYDKGDPLERVIQIVAASFIAAGTGDVTPPKQGTPTSKTNDHPL